MGCAVHIKEDRCLNIEVNRKPVHIDQYLLFDSHHPLEHKLGVIGALNHRAETVPKKTEGKEKEQKQIRGALQTCGYPNWTFVKTYRRSRADREEQTGKRNNIVIPLEHLRCSGGSSLNIIPVHFKPTNTLRQKPVHPKDKTPRHKQSDVVYAVQCSQDCTDLYSGETQQPLHKRVAQHRRVNFSGQDRAVHLHPKKKNHSFEDNNVNI